jgi:hypothetical protein
MADDVSPARSTHGCRFVKWEAYKDGWYVLRCCECSATVSRSALPSNPGQIFDLQENVGNYIPYSLIK